MVAGYTTYGRLDGELMGSTRAVLRANAQNAYAETGVEWTVEAELNIWIQEAHDQIVQRAPYYTLTATTPLVASQYKYADSDSTYNFFPIKIESIEALADAGTTYVILRYIPYWKYQKLMESQFTTTTPLTTGTPTYWTWHAGYFYLYPTPSYDEAAGLRVTASARDILDADGDTTHLPAAFERLIVTYCLSKMYKKDDQIQKASFYDAEFERGVSDLMQWLQTSRSTEPTRLPTMDERRVRVG